MTVNDSNIDTSLGQSEAPSRRESLNYYMQAIMMQTVPPRSQVLTWGQEMSSTRRTFSQLIFRHRMVLTQCHRFLNDFVQNWGRWDLGFEVSQKNAEAIGQLKRRLPNINRQLKQYLAKNSETHLPANTSIQKSINELPIRISQKISWYRIARNQPRTQPDPILQNAGKSYSRYVAAKQQLAKSCIRLVAKIANQYRSSGAPLMELIQDGNVGLLTAAEKFDYSKGLAFSTYASVWIRQKINLGLRRRRIIHIPLAQASRIARCKAEIQQRQQRNQSTSQGTLASSVLAANQISEHLYIAFQNNVVHLEQLKNDECDNPFELEDTRTAPHFCENDTTQLLKKLASAIANLDHRQRTILELRFGLNGNKVHSLSKVGAKTGVTHQRVQQIQIESLKILRDSLKGYEDLVV